MKGKMQAKKVIVEIQAVALPVAAGGSRIEEGVGVGVGVGGSRNSNATAVVVIL